jgi:hypothetical protein
VREVDDVPISFANLIAEVRQTRHLDALVRQHMFQGTPFVFSALPSHYDLLRSHLSRELRVPPEAITVVGSCRLGYSLNPDHPGYPATELSDVDVIVADEALFDRLWGLLLRWRYPWHLRRWSDPEREWGTRLLENFILGQCEPHRIRFARLGSTRHRRELLAFADQWFSAFKSTSRYTELAGRDFKGRLYRSWQFATMYHAFGLRHLAQVTPPPTTAAA